MITEAIFLTTHTHVCVTCRARADKATESITAAKTEALARARAEAAEIMAGTHDAAVEDVKALRSKLNEQNQIIAQAKEDLQAAGEEVKALKDET